MRLTSYLTALPRDISFVKSLSLSYIYIITYIFKKIKKDLLLGGEDGSRTHDLLNAIQALSQAELHPHIFMVPRVGLEPTECSF